MCSRVNNVLTSSISIRSRFTFDVDTFVNLSTWHSSHGIYSVTFITSKSILPLGFQETQILIGAAGCGQLHKVLCLVLQTQPLPDHVEQTTMTQARFRFDIIMFTHNLEGS